MTDLSLLLSLVLAHVLADFFFQPTAWVQARASQHWRAAALYYHSLLHFGLTLAVLSLWHWLSWSMLSAWLLLGSALLIAASHCLIDVAKSYRPGFRYFLLDQLLHMLVIVLVWLALTDTSMAQLLAMAQLMLNPNALLLVLAYLLLLKPASVVIGFVLNQIATPATGAGSGLPTAGHWIGMMERVLVLTLILVGQYGGVGFVIAAKSVLRFSDLRNANDRALTEYILLGSLLSLGLTLVLGIGVVQLLG
ncbi:DUF3307 domain-containing protein [Alkalimonas amylolytica]|uniref:DUF3307 domain-containing protein n=1 Tax=Alkalimonas amylolytica TaxID=152573 RepID=A0A1H4BTH8_ALKAM|nr:DUF3307 domain-containing protein [Alkalimonas amylolytica]SEA51390.1 Protein of unknown function [Alkalimonas amylolytica]